MRRLSLRTDSAGACCPPCSSRAWVLALGLCLGAAAGCSSAGGGGGSGGRAGVPGTGGAQGGSGGAPAATGGATVGSGGAGSGGTTTGSAGSSGSGGSGALTGTTGGSDGGAGRGGASGGASAMGGSASGGRGGGAVGSGGVGGAAGGVSCAGRALSLAPNGTGTASDAAYSRVEIDLMGELPIGNATRTVEFWAFIKTTDWVGEKNEVFEYGAAGNASTFGLDFGTNAVMGMPDNHATLNPFTGGGFNDDSTKYLGITSANNQWVHIAMTWDGTALRTYVNGVLGIETAGSGGTAALATARSPLVMGCNFQNMNCFAGLIDELRVWKVARTASEIKDHFNRGLVGDDTGLVGYWKFDDDPSSTTAADSIAVGRTRHPGTLLAAASAQRPLFTSPPMLLPLLCP
ncbi:MAG: LamG domain-containing protein [Polyangia bacterium]